MEVEIEVGVAVEVDVEVQVELEVGEDGKETVAYNGWNNIS